MVVVVARAEAAAVGYRLGERGQSLVVTRRYMRHNTHHITTEPEATTEYETEDGEHRTHAVTFVYLHEHRIGPTFDLLDKIDTSTLHLDFRLLGAGF